MNEDLSLSNLSADEERLSAEDLAVLQAFDNMEIWNTRDISSNVTDTQDVADDSYDDMLVLFAAEADEDIALMRRALSQLEQGDALDPSRFKTLRRVAHKIRGTAGAMEYHAMATIAYYIEEIVAQTTKGALFPLIGLNALVQAVLALEQMLESIVTSGQESNARLTELEGELEQLNVTVQSSESASSASRTITTPLPEAAIDVASSTFQEELSTASLSSTRPLIRVDERRFKHLMHHSEQLAELRTPLESAQGQVNTTLQELHIAQARLQQLETSLTNLSSNTKPSHITNNHPASSLIARILSDASQRNNGTYSRKIRPRPHLVKVSDTASWDELDLERYTERDTMVQSLREAIANATLASSRVQIAYTHLNLITQRYMAQIARVRHETLLLRLVPLSTLVPGLQHIITTSMMGQAQQVCFEVIGETSEVDQDILAAIAVPLLQLLRTCITDTLPTLDKPEHESHRIWLHAQSISNEIMLELGFSMTVQGGALEAVRRSIQHLNGSVSLQRNTTGGVSFCLRFPRSHGTVHCLLVRVGKQYVVVPFSQVKRVGDEKQEELDIVYHLSKLLDFPTETDSQTRITPVLVLPKGAARLVAGVVVDEVVGTIEAVVKPLADYLHRPGIVGSIVDGSGHVLLLLDLPELVKYYNTVRRQSMPEGHSSNAASSMKNTLLKVLVADDSVYLRQSLLQMLEHSKYVTAEARDGMEALELLTQNPPDIFLLDMEMPNLNGYDVLNIMHLYPELNNIKVIVLTSRSSEKHKQRALGLGAHAYLTKPCTQETLLGTISALLARE